MRTRQSAGAVLLSVIVVFSMLSIPAPVAANPPGELADDEVFQATGNVDVWKRSIFTLRHDFAGAPTSVPVGEGDLRAGLDGQATTKSLDENPLGVRTVDETVTLTFDDTRTLAPDAITGTPEVQLIAARLQGTGEQVRTFEGAIDLLDTENANENATFEQVGDIKTLNSDGTITFSHDPGLGPGHYVYFLTGVNTPNNNRFNINNNDISISGDVTVYGVEQITFQKGAPTNINPPSAVIPGNDLSFGIDTTGQFSNSNDVTHTVLVYDNSTVRTTLYLHLMWTILIKLIVILT